MTRWLITNLREMVPRRCKNASRSRSRRDLNEAAAEEILSPDANGVANIRFSARIVTKTDHTVLMPFALIAPEPNKRHQHLEFVVGSIPISERTWHDLVPPTQSVRNCPFFNGRPGDLKGMFIRKFRWGTVDVLNPSQCDFSAVDEKMFSPGFRRM